MPFLSEVKAQVWMYLCVALLVALVALGVTYKIHVGALNLTIDSQADKISQLTDDNRTLKQNNQDLKTAVDRQNLQLRNLLLSQKEASDAAQKAIDEAKNQAKKWRKVYQDLLNQPKPDPDDCKATQILLERYTSLRGE